MNYEILLAVCCWVLLVLASLVTVTGIASIILHLAGFDLPGRTMEGLLLLIGTLWGLYTNLIGKVSKFLSTRRKKKIHKHKRER